MSDGILFDNFIITDNKRVADQWAADSWRLKHGEENAAAVSICKKTVRKIKNRNLGKES